MAFTDSSTCKIMQDNTRELARDFIWYRLGKASSDRQGQTAANICRLSDELELQNGAFLDSVCHQLQLNPDSAHSLFLQIADEVFKEGINWGRIVAVFTFGGRLAINLQQCGEEKGEEIAEWLGDYMTKLSDWIQNHGGWEAFNRQYQDRTRPLRIGWSRMVLTTIGLGALATIIYQHKHFR